MLLPSGRSNSDVQPRLNAQRPSILVNKNSSPALSNSSFINTTATSNKRAISTTQAQNYDTQLHQKLSSTSERNNFLPSPGSQSDVGNGCGNVSVMEYNRHSPRSFHSDGMLATTTTTTAATTTNNSAAMADEGIEPHLQTIQLRLKRGWTVHTNKDGRLYYCNHLTQTAGWLPSCEDWSRSEDLPYGWERAVDSKGRPYFLNHLTKTSTYEAPETIHWDENPPEPRVVVLQRSSTMGFGFVAGSEKPVIVRFVTENGPSIDKLLPGDHILAVNGEDVKDAPRDHVIQLVRACESQVTLLVCQPAHNLVPGRKSTLLSARKRAKLRSRPSRVRFAESVCVNGAPLFPPSAFSLGDICVPPMANVLKVFLENGQTKSFKYDATTTVQDVVSSLLDKLCLTAGQIFCLVLEHVKSLKRNKLTLLDPEEPLARIAARPGAHKLRCLFRVTFVPLSAADLAQRDLNALDYLYMQCCNDVTQERFAPELQPEVALRLAALHMHQHALANNVSPVKLTVKVVEREFGLERFVPASLLDAMKRKELRRLISHFLKLNAEMTNSSKVLTQLQAKLHYLDIISSLPSYGAKCFSTNQSESLERVLLVSPRFGLSQISSARNSVPQPISAIEDFSHIIVTREDDVTCTVNVFMHGDRVIKFSMEDLDACEFCLSIAGYYRLLKGKELPVQRDREPIDEDHAPLYLAQHTVVPAIWSYLPPYHNRLQSMNFLMTPPYHATEYQQLQQQSTIEEEISTTPICDRNMNSANVANSNHHKPLKISIMNTAAMMDLDIHSVVATELLEEAKDSGMSDSSGGGCSSERQHLQQTETRNEEVLRRVHEMQKMVENSEQYLSEQGEPLPLYDDTNRIPLNLVKQTDSLHPLSSTTGVIEFDSDCDSLNSSKFSSSEDTPQPGALKHSDSLVLLAEAINQDLSGISKGLNSIGGSQPELALYRSNLSAASSPRPERKINGLSQLLNNLQALSADFSQSESDSESVKSPANSPTAQRRLQVDQQQRKKNAAYRTSFGLHSPDGSNFGPEMKDYNLKEYLQQLKDISNVDNTKHDTDTAAKKLSEIYGFEIRGDTFIETDGDVIDLRALPPPQTPSDEIDGLSLLNAAPQGFDDNTSSNATAAAKVDATDLDQFLAKVVVAPPTQKATPAKELTPEEISSFIIPPPPKLDSKPEQQPERVVEAPESLYSNAVSEKRKIFERNRSIGSAVAQPAKQSPLNRNRVIEYATVERRNKFSCCPTTKKAEEPTEILKENSCSSPKLPPRTPTLDAAPPARPPKSAHIQRLSPKKQLFENNCNSRAIIGVNQSLAFMQQPPQLPPRLSPTTRAGEPPQSPLQPTQHTSSYQTTAVSIPKKPPLPPVVSRPLIMSPQPNPNATKFLTRTPTTPQTPPPIQPRTYNNLATAQPTMPPTSAINAQIQRTTVALPPSSHSTNGHCRSNSDCPPTCLHNPSAEKRPQLSLLCSPQMPRKVSSPIIVPAHKPIPYQSDKLIIKNGHIIDGEALLAKTDVAMAGLLIKLDQVAASCAAAQAAGGGANIDEEKFQRARQELTEQTVVLVTASKFLVVAMSDATLTNLPEHLTSCLTAIRRITELTQDMTRHTSAPLQTRNIVLKVHDVTSSFRELVQVGPLGAGQLALQAECLANVLATLLRSLRVFSP